MEDKEFLDRLILQLVENEGRCGHDCHKTEYRSYAIRSTAENIMAARAELKKKWIQE